MIFAEVLGKFSDRGQRSEDILTSTAFGLLRYIPIERGLLPLLRRARRIVFAGGRLQLTAGARWLPLSAASDISVNFWPSFAPHGVPDIVLHIQDEARRLSAVILVEVKLHSGKSGSAESEDGADESTPEEPDPDQLVKYWQGLCAKYESVPTEQCAIIYLTSHPSPPIDELRDTLARRADVRLGWLSWQDVFRVVADADDLPARDLARLLEHKGFRPFAGLCSVQPRFNADARLWPSQGARSANIRRATTGPWDKDGEWFQRHPPLIPSTRYWSAT